MHYKNTSASNRLWSRQRISVQNNIPENFTEYIIDESEFELDLKFF